MGQTSSQVATQSGNEPEAIDKQEKRKKSKRRKEKRLTDREDYAEEDEEDEIAQTLLEMKGSQDLEATGSSDNNDTAAANQLLAESSPARHATSAMVNGGPVQSVKKSTAKAKSKKNRRLQSERSTDLGAGTELYNYIEELIGPNAPAADDHVNGSPTDPQGLDPFSMPVPNLDEMDRSVEYIDPDLREDDGSSAIQVPSTPTSYVEGGLNHERTVCSPFILIVVWKSTAC